MKIAGNLIVVAALVLASAPAFARGGGMGGMGGMGHKGVMGHNTGMTVNTQTHDWHTNGTNVSKNTTKTRTFFFKKTVRIQREITRLNQKLIELLLDGKGNSREFHVLSARLLKLEHVG